MKKIAIIMCNDMHMDLERSNILLNYIKQNTEYEIVCDYTIADVIIIQTCAFGNGKRYTIQVIADIRLNSKPKAKIIVTGCLLGINRQELEALPGIEVESFEKLIESLKKEEQYNYNEKLVPQNKVIISEGCLKKCSYCVYPLIVGKYRSKSIENILLEVEQLYETETNIYITGAQETSDYGVDLYGKPSFARLIQEICKKFPNCNYIIGWFHPAGLTEEIISVIAENKNITTIMLHIQHVDNKILKSMNRPLNELTDVKIQKLRSLRPDLIISTEVIVGFPGETELEFKKLVDYFDKNHFDDIGVASYERVLGTGASVLEDQIPEEIKSERLQFFQKRFKTCVYPGNDENFIMSVIEEYIKAYCLLKKMPKNILQERQEYNYIAGVDTKMKIEIEKTLKEVLECIINSRSEFDFKRTCKFLSEKYTFEARKFFYDIIKEGDFKDGIKKKSKILLLDLN